VSDPTLFPPGDYARFISKIEKTATCWLWKSAIDGGGYGRFPIRRKNHLAHRWSYSYHVGPIPDGLQLDHLCRIRNCVNPDHLEPVTARENTIRGVSTPAQNAARAECVKGHPFTPENTYFKTTSRGTEERHCRECARQANRDWYKVWKANGGTRSRGKRTGSGATKQR
jgi:hypothetical protein